MESNHNHNLKVGIFVSIGLFALLISIILLGGEKSFFTSYSTYKVSLKHSQGLAAGSVVSLAGIKVGNIKKISFRADDKAQDVGTFPLEAIIEVESDYSKQITTGTEAQIKTQGALGDKFIYLVPGNPTKDEIQEGGSIPSDGRSDFLDALSEKSDDISKIGDVIAELHILFKSLNEKNLIGSTLENLNSSTGKLDHLITELHSLANDVRGGKKSEHKLREGVAHLSNIFKKIDKGEGSLGAIINDSRLHDKLLEFMGSTPRRKILKPLIRATIQDSE